MYHRTPFLTFFLLWFAVGLPLQAQPLDDLDRISLAVVTPTSYGGLSAGQLSSLRGKIVRMVTTNGLSGDGYDADLVIYPVFDIQDQRTVEVTLRNLTVVEGELSLYVKNVDQDLIFASFSLPFQGHGTSRGQAITNALQSIKASDPAVAGFFDDAKRRIASYYEAECDNLLRNAATLTQTQSFDEAFGLLMSIPSAAPGCYERAQRAAVVTFQAYQAQQCGELIQAARAAITNNSYTRGLQLLAHIDPSSSCHAESVRLMNSIAGSVDARDQRYYETLQTIYRTEASLERERIRAVRDIAKAYYTYRQPRVEYHTLVNTTVVH